MKVVQVYKQAFPEYGGIEADITQIFDSISNEEFTKEILCCSNKYKTEMVKDVKYTRCKYLFELASNYISPSFIYNLSKVKTDIIHYHMPCIFAVIAHYIAKPKYKKMIISYHGGIYGYDKYMKFFSKLYNQFYKDADLIHVYTSNLIDTDTVLTENKHKTFILPYSININNNFSKAQQNKTIQLLCMGRLVHWKGIQNAIKAMVNVQNAHLNIVGDGPYRNALEKLACELSVENKISFLGKITNQKEKEDVFKSTDIFIFPSIRRSESFGQVQIQTMQYEIPVINTRLNTGVNYISIDNETGLTVEPDNVEELTNAINELIDNTQKRIQLGKNARKRVIDLFNLEKNKESYRQMYNGLMYE